MSDVKVGIVGLAFGSSHIATIENIPGVRVAAIADNVPPRGKNKGMSVDEYAQTFGAVGYTDGIKMIEEADIDAVDLVVAPKWREPLLRAAAKRGLPTLIEKPMANTIAQAQQFAQIAKDGGIPLMVEYPMRFFPATQRLKELLNDGPLGKPLAVSGELQTSWNPPAGHWSWAEDVPGGWVTECGCHLLDTLIYLTGTPVKVSAMGRNYHGHGQTVDSAGLNIQFDNGAYATANLGGIGTMAFNVPMYVHIMAEKGEAMLLGENWVYNKVVWALHGKEVVKNEESLPAPPRNELLRHNMENFIKVVRDKAKPACSVEDGIIVQKLIAAMDKSLASGKVEAI